MALSNWDCIYFTQPKLDNENITLENVRFNIYKSSFYVRVKDVEVQLCNGWMVANGIYVYATELEYSRSDKFDTALGVENVAFLACAAWQPTAFVGGIGCYGYLGGLEVIRRFYPEVYRTIPEEYIYDPKYQHSNQSTSDDDFTTDELVIYDTTNFETVWNYKWPTMSLDELWVGVEPWMVNKYIEWVKELEIKEIAPFIECIRTAERFNAGDQYFYNQILQAETPTTKVGQAEPPLINKLIEE